MTTGIFVADLHVNSTVAVCPPVVNLDDGGTYHATRTQRWLWDSWTGLWQDVDRGTPKGDRVLFVVGDLGELDTEKRSIQLISLNKDTIIGMCIDVLEPALSVVDRVYFFRGTPAHSGRSAWLEEHVARDIDTSVPYSKEIDQETGEEKKTIASWWHLRGRINASKIDVCHHVGGSVTPNAGNNLGIKILSKYALNNWDRPDLVLRAHVHKFRESGKNLPLWAAICPAWTTITEYGYRIGMENDISDIGMIVVNFGDIGFTQSVKILHIEESRSIWSRKV